MSTCLEECGIERAVCILGFIPDFIGGQMTSTSSSFVVQESIQDHTVGHCIQRISTLFDISVQFNAKAVGIRLTQTIPPVLSRSSKWIYLKCKLNKEMKSAIIQCIALIPQSAIQLHRSSKELLRTETCHIIDPCMLHVQHACIQYPPWNNGFSIAVSITVSVSIRT